jgi:hypothetical protein
VAVKLNVWLAWLSSTNVVDEVVAAVEDVTTYLLLNVRRIAAGVVSAMVFESPLVPPPLYALTR